MSDSSPIVLWTVPGPPTLDAFSIDLALREKGLEFERRTAESFRFEHGSVSLTYSLAANEYLAETFPFPHHPRLFPADLGDRARCRELMLRLRDSGAETAWPELRGEFLFAQWCIADAELAFSLQRRTDLTPVMQAYVERQLERAQWKRT